MLQLLVALAIQAQTVPESATVPLLVEGNVPIVEVEFLLPSGKHRKARFLIDTGGGAFMIGSSLLADLRTKPTGPAFKGDGGRIVPLGALPGFLGAMPLDFTGVPAYGMLDAKWCSNRDHTEGMIPAKLLRRYHVVFDYPKRQFTLSKTAAPHTGGVELKTPISTEMGFIRVEVGIDGKTYGVLLDTGASFTMMSREFLDSWHKEHPEWPTATGATGFANMFGGPLENQALMLRIPKLSIGSCEVKDVGMVSRTVGTFEKWMSGMMTAPIIGSFAGNVWRDFRVEIDYEKGVTYLDQSGTTPDSDAISVGLILTPAPGGKLLVSGVSSAAADEVRASIFAGDYLVSIDGLALADKSMIAAAAALSGKPGDRKKLVLEREGKVVRVTATVKALF